MNTNQNQPVEMIDFDVRIPNLEGDGVAEIRTIKVPARKTGAGEFRLTAEALELIERTQARYMGLLSPGEIKDLRMRIQFTQREMSELIQAGEKSYTRWENGKVRLSRLVNIILCGIRDGFLPLSYLQTLYKDGSDWYKKVQNHEAQLSKPIMTPIPTPGVATNPVSVITTELVVFKSDLLNFFRVVSKSNQFVLAT